MFYTCLTVCTIYLQSFSIVQLFFFFLYNGFSEIFLRFPGIITHFWFCLLYFTPYISSFVTNRLRVGHSILPRRAFRLSSNSAHLHTLHPNENIRYPSRNSFPMSKLLPVHSSFFKYIPRFSPLVLNINYYYYSSYKYNFYV